MAQRYLCIQSFGKPMSWENVHLEKRARTRPLGREHLPQAVGSGPATVAGGLHPVEARRLPSGPRLASSGGSYRLSRTRLRVASLVSTRAA